MRAASPLHLRPLLPRHPSSAAGLLRPHWVRPSLHCELDFAVVEDSYFMCLFKTDKPSQVSFWDVDGKQIVFKSLYPDSLLTPCSLPSVSVCGHLWRTPGD